ncbi:MAG: hypothetical protein K5829_01865 [Treponema sp.]|nr:hypothetical protein [Treponema sp.]
MKNNVKKTLSLALAASLACTTSFAADGTLSADFSKATTDVSKNLFGIFLEDINYAADGGLYGELIQNRSFEFRNSRKSPTESWTNVNKNGNRSKSRIKGAKNNPLNENNPVYASLTVKQAGDGIANKGYGGIPFNKGKKYPASLYLRSSDSSIKSVTITAGSSKKGAQIFTTKISGITNEWKKYSFDIIPVETVSDGQFALYPDSTGIVDIDFVSVFRPEDEIYKAQENGLRKDLVEKLEDLQPAFVRFPGGCIVHGMTLADRYQWKKTIGPLEERIETANFWGYQQSYGIGFYEYFRLCEDLNADAIPVLSCGMAHGGEISSVSDYEWYAQDALDMIEWATGPATSKWGKLRAEAGHPEPFELKYIGIGNEDCGMDYFDRFKYISEKIKEKYPQIKTIISSGYTYNDINFHNTWNQVRRWEKNKKTADLTDLVDEHYYNPYSWFLSNGKRYDNLDFYPRGEGQPTVFIGEYASWVDGRRNNLYSALTEAAYMTSIERNGDIVEIAAYAPLFARDGKTQWVPDMIWFNDREVYASPDYYVQQLFMTKKSDKTIPYSITQPKSNKAKEYIGGTIGIGTWSTTAQFKDISVKDNDTGKVIYDSNSKKSKLEDFRQESGIWQQSGETFIQSSADTNVRAILDNEAQIKGIKNYTLELNAQKTGGAEGFLIMFGVKGKSLYWWNMGGWGNTQSVIEKGTAEGRSTIGDSIPMTLNEGQWYNIKIEVSGESYKCYLDGQLMHEFTDVMNFDSLFAHVGKSDDGKIIIKIVNVDEKAQEIAIYLKNAPAILPDAKVTILTSGSLTDENSFAEPTKVSPVTESFNSAAAKFNYKVKANSLTIIEMETK